MSDMLIKLYDLPPLDETLADLAGMAISIRRAMAYEHARIHKWIADAFNTQWADECHAGFGTQPIGCFLALKEQEICGFCCIDCTFRNFLGPIGIVPEFRNKRIGQALLQVSLRAMQAQGYAYAIVGDVGEPGFFQKAAGAVVIPASAPGPYPPRLKSSESMKPVGS